ncbi:MAG: glycosyltransferase [Planctomycetes bacterium]|jgi:hypothetical protein|nr:glycosyltransferase [Planctomycetota bacterium]
MISVVVPAYNEEAVIERCLKALTDGAPAGALEVVVACNGCHDRTAEIAEAFGPPVRVVQTTTASKVAALNLGDAAVTGFPRFYVDADVILPWPTVRATAQALERSGKPAGAPRLEMDLSGSGPGVRAYYAVWLKLTFHRAGMIGCGVYVLSAEGRARFGEFPDLIADDAFVRSRFVDSERAMPDNDATVIVAGPRTLGELIKIKTRSRLGLAQLRAYEPDRYELGLKKDRWFFGPVLARPWLWPCALVYLYVNLASRLRARRQLRSIETYRWERDESSRTAAAPAS